MNRNNAPKAASLKCLLQCFPMLTVVRMTWSIRSGNLQVLSTRMLCWSDWSSLLIIGLNGISLSYLYFTKQDYDVIKLYSCAPILIQQFFLFKDIVEYNSVVLKSEHIVTQLSFSFDNNLFHLNYMLSSLNLYLIRCY